MIKCSSTGSKRTSSQHGKQRIPEVDALRGVFIGMMVVFHLLVDLHWLGITPAWYTSLVWWIWSKITATGFLVLVGISLQLWYQDLDYGESTGWLLKRTLKKSWPILAWAYTITAVTWLIEVRMTVWFGILHLIGFAIASSGIWLRWTRGIWLLQGIVVLGWMWSQVREAPAGWLTIFGFVPRNYTSFDHFPFIPWFGTILGGVLLIRTLKQPLEHMRSSKLSRMMVQAKCLQWLGRHSLSVYLLHQPVLLAGLWLMTRMWELLSV